MIDPRLAPYGALLLRVALGAMFVAHGLLKVFVFTPAGFAGFLGQLAYPGALAWPIILAEVAGGLALILGVYARAVALLLVPVLVGATLVHLPNGWLFTAANGGWEYPAYLTLAALAQALIGDGALALRRTPVPALGSAGAPAPRAA